MKLSKKGITIEVESKTEIDRLKRAGYEQVVAVPEPVKEPVTDPVKEPEPVAPKAVAEPKKATEPKKAGK